MRVLGLCGLVGFVVGLLGSFVYRWCWVFTGVFSCFFLFLLLFVFFLYTSYMLGGTYAFYKTSLIIPIKKKIFNMMNQMIVIIRLF